jgi:hypothetical protein
MNENENDIVPGKAARRAGRNVEVSPEIRGLIVTQLAKALVAAYGQQEHEKGKRIQAETR